MKTLQKVLLIASVLGIGLTTYLVYQHFKPVGESFCNFNNYVNCDIVNKSEYSTLFGVPVSVLGLGAYVFFFIYSILLMKKMGRTEKLLPVALGFSLLSLGFSLYLTYIEFFVLYAVCIFCLSQQVVIILITLLIALLVWKSKKSY